MSGLFAPKCRKSGTFFCEEKWRPLRYSLCNALFGVCNLVFEGLIPEFHLVFGTNLRLPTPEIDFQNVAQWLWPFSWWISTRLILPLGPSDWLITNTVLSLPLSLVRAQNLMMLIILYNHILYRFVFIAPFAVRLNYDRNVNFSISKSNENGIFSSPWINNHCCENACARALIIHMYVYIWKQNSFAHTRSETHIRSDEMKWLLLQILKSFSIFIIIAFWCCCCCCCCWLNLRYELEQCEWHTLWVVSHSSSKMYA